MTDGESTIMSPVSRSSFKTRQLGLGRLQKGLECEHVIQETGGGGLEGVITSIIKHPLGVISNH